VRIWWVLLAIIFGVLAATAAYLWPVSLFWIVQLPEEARVLNISPDGSSIYTLHESKDGSLFIVRWDAKTGKEIQRTVMQEVNTTQFRAKGMFTHDLRLARDSKTVFIGLPVLGPAINSWYLHDAETGKRLAGPILDVAHFNPEADSLDGRWFWVYHGDRNKPNLNEGLDVYAARTGEQILKLRNNDGMSPWSLQFSPDGNTAAVHWTSGRPGSSKKSLITILELPAGREINRFELPGNHKWMRIDAWDGQYLQAEHAPEHPDFPGKVGYYLRRTVRFDSMQKPVGEGIEEPLLSGEVRSTEGQTFWDECPDRVVYYRFVRS
jgi:WD40 repeat protein